MTTYTYRQPVTGQAFVDLIEGRHPKMTLDRFVGKYVAVCCFGSSRIGPGRAALDAMRRHKGDFDNVKTVFLGIAIDPREHVDSIALTGVYYHLDADGAMSRQCGAVPLEAVPFGTQFRVAWTIVDPALRVRAHFHTNEDPAEFEAVFALLNSLPEMDQRQSCEVPAPILVIPRLFEPGFCEKLIGLYEEGHPHDSGFMRNNVEIFDYSFKRRRDYFVGDESVKQQIIKRISICVIPEIRKLFFMEITRMERYLVACYAAEEEAHFRPHRDNGQRVTAHRRFAISVALNDDFDGGDLLFPEYNQRPHRIPKGWAIVFPGAILHAVTPVTRGRRYVFLPFLFDEGGAKLQAGAATAAGA
jgi:2OG-Fe(II) oxygenase superfamily